MTTEPTKNEIEYVARERFGCHSAHAFLVHSFEGPGIPKTPWWWLAIKQTADSESQIVGRRDSLAALLTLAKRGPLEDFRDGKTSSTARRPTGQGDADREADTGSLPTDSGSLVGR